jgi:putative colanic acid biosynthesis acetyltransferase WcaF
MILLNNKNESDAYLHPVFSLRNRMLRFFWTFTWIVLCKWTPKPFHNWRILILRIFGAEIGKNNCIYPNSKIWAPWLLKTEDAVAIGPGVEIYNPGGIRLSHHAILSQDSYLCGATHEYNSKYFTFIKKEIIVEAYVWICARAIVLPGVTCGEGSVLGSGSVTSKNLEPWTVYAGNPAKPINKRVNCFSSVNH